MSELPTPRALFLCPLSLSSCASRRVLAWALCWSPKPPQEFTGLLVIDSSNQHGVLTGLKALKILDYLFDRLSRPKITWETEPHSPVVIHAGKPEILGLKVLKHAACFLGEQAALFDLFKYFDQSRSIQTLSLHNGRKPAEIWAFDKGPSQRDGPMLFRVDDSGERWGVDKGKP
jgi:hypothetical protein